MVASTRKKITISIAKTVLQVREWKRENLPNANSELALELFFVISYHSLLEKPLNLKVLFCTLNFSEAGIRKQLQLLLNDEWITFVGNQNDKRSKHVVAQPKMITAFNKYCLLLKTSFNRSPSSLNKIYWVDSRSATRHNDL